MTNLGKYEIIELLGSGATADVYHARDSVLGREVALKILKPALVVDQAAFQRFVQEARAAAGLFHPHIATVLDMGDADGRYFIAMRYYPGRSLDRLLKEDGPLSWMETLRLAEQIGAALDYAHSQGFLHRDVKPSNILRTPQGEFILTDFGLTRAMMSTGLTSHTGAVLGTPPYIAPEIWLGEKAVPATDQYALACVIYEALTGQTLFAGETPPAIMTRHVLKGAELPGEWPAGTPAGVAIILFKALNKDPSSRHASASEMAQSLQKLVAVALPPLTQSESVAKTDTADSSKSVLCPRCRNPIRMGNSFCQYCGAQVSLPISGSDSAAAFVPPTELAKTETAIQSAPRAPIAQPRQDPNRRTNNSGQTYPLGQANPERGKNPSRWPLWLLAAGALCIIGLMVFIELQNRFSASARQTSDAQVFASQTISAQYTQVASQTNAAIATLDQREIAASTVRVQEVAAAQARATATFVAQVIANAEEKAEVIFGPTEGVIVQDTNDNSDASFAAGVELKNFTVEATFINAGDHTQYPWNYAIDFRETYTDYAYFLSIFSDRRWQLEVDQSGSWSTVAYGLLENLDTSPNGSNQIRLFVLEDMAFFFLNGNFIEALDVSENHFKGDIRIIVNKLMEINGEESKIQDISVWQLPE